MNKEQQGGQKIVFIKPIKPFAKAVPTATQFSNLKNASVYGVWVDGRKVDNSYLEKFSNTDFSHIFISKLYGGAKTNKTYTHQADLMTNAYYKDYYEQSIAKKAPVMMSFGNKK
jgi:hypothetical protein